MDCWPWGVKRRKRQWISAENRATPARVGYARIPLGRAENATQLALTGSSCFDRRLKNRVIAR
jgi:hypothetical protein